MSTRPPLSSLSASPSSIRIVNSNWENWKTNSPIASNVSFMPSCNEERGLRVVIPPPNKSASRAAIVSARKRELQAASLDHRQTDAAGRAEDGDRAVWRQLHLSHYIRYTAENGEGGMIKNYGLNWSRDVAAERMNLQGKC